MPLTKLFSVYSKSIEGLRRLGSMGSSSVLLLSKFVSLLDSFFIGLRLTFSTFSTMISFFGEILSHMLLLDDERDSCSFFPDFPESCN